MRNFSLCYLRQTALWPTLLAFILLLPLVAGGSFVMAATQQESLHKAIQDFETLSQDERRGMWRDSWEKLENRFEKIQGQGPDYAAEAFFYRARSLEELADRSKNKNDWKNAAKLYENFISRYKKHPLADNAAYNRAMILSGPLGDKNAAVRVLDAILTDYPDGDAFSDAIILRERLAPDGSAATVSAQATSHAQAQARQASPDTVTPAALERQKQLYTAAASEWRSLLVDQKRGSMRDNWLNLEKSFDSALKAAPTGPEAHKAAYQVARSREELAQRSGLKSDWKEATELFATMVANYPQSSLADDSLYYQAEILAKRLKNNADARDVLNDLLSRYADGDMAAKARKLLNELPKSSGKSAGQAKTSKPSSAQSSAKPVARAAPSGNIVEQLGLGIKTIMIDAGHGGKDPGAIGNGLRESTVTLDLAKKLGAELKKKGFTVLYTRENNRFVALEDRTSLANNKKADVFVSIHVNASTNKKLYGLETYYLDVARSDAARVVAARENSVNVGTASDLQFILSDLTRNTKKEESLALAKKVQNSCISRLGKSGFKVRSNGVRSAPFYVLMGARMPAFLIEVGYLSNSADATRIKNSKYIQAIAGGISDGIVAYQKELNRLAR